jgi:hypothetical protein
MKVSRPKPRRLVVEVSRLSPTARRERREFDQALKAVPRPIPWEWGAPRVLPLLAGPRFDRPGESLVRTTSVLGPAIEFGIPIGRAFGRIDRPVAERWEVTVEQLLDRAMGNLSERAADLDANALITGVLSGRALRLLDGDPPWASSLLLDREALLRVFGAQDQVFAAARTDCLVSVPRDVPSRAVAEIVVDLEREEQSLWLDPFVLEGGELTWSGTYDEDDDDVLED